MCYLMCPEDDEGGRPNIWQLIAPPAPLRPNLPGLALYYEDYAQLCSLIYLHKLD